MKARKKNAPNNRSRSVQKLFLEQLKELPKIVLKNLVSEKLEKQGFVADVNLVDALIKHILSNSQETFEWEDGNKTNSHFELTFDQTDVAKLEETLKSIQLAIPKIVDVTTENAAKLGVRALKKKWPEQSEYENSILFGFQQRLLTRWGKGLELLRILLTACREVNVEEYQKARKSKSTKNQTLSEALVRLHARACQVSTEILVLLENGLADGAMARWRTLFEIGVVITLLVDGGEILAKHYADHEIVDRKTAFDEYERSHVLLGFRSTPIKEKKRLLKAFSEVENIYGKEFPKPYGWAAKYLKKKKVTFLDLENAAQKSAMRSYYKLASNNVHAGALGISHRLGVMGSTSLILSGPSNAGLIEPGQNMAITISQITALLLNRRPAKIDQIIMMKMLFLLKEEIIVALSQAHRKLEQEHKSEMGKI